jgi:hypothetical protein
VRYIRALPGGDLIARGLADRARGVSSIEALLVSIGAPRLARRFMRAFGAAAEVPTRVYFTGSATAVLRGWRLSTIDVDISPASFRRSVEDAFGLHP